MKISQYFLSIFFICAISLPIIGEVSQFGAGKAIEENRGLDRSKRSLLQQVYSYLQNYESRFIGRNVLIRSYIQLKKDILKTSPLPEKVVIGKNGWLYLADYGTMDDCRNIRPFSTGQLDSIQTHLTKISDDLKTGNVKLYVVVVPDKHTIYPEFLPENVKKLNPVSRLQQLSRHLEDNGAFEFIDLTDTLLQSKDKGLLYLTMESHWNDFGTFISYRRIMHEIRKDFPGVRVLDLKDCNVFQGEESDIDLMKLLGESSSFTEESLKIIPTDSDSIVFAPHGVTIPKAKQFNEHYAFRKLNNRIDEPSAIVYRDSFFASLVPYFEQSFHNSTYISTNDVDINYVKAHKAQLVVLEIAERHIDLLMR